jgi:predicted secreted Zn-dependent protease
MIRAGLCSLGLVAAICAVLGVHAAKADVVATEVVETYAISGRTGADLYAAIGERGPELGANRVIAHTRFKLTWRRDYQTRGSDCVLATAVPKLTIITTLPKPTAKLEGPVRAGWERFIAGVRKHEAVHAAYVKDLVRDIEAATVGLVQPNDPGCKAIRTEMNRRLGAISDARRLRDRAFDSVELTEGGAVHNLILALVNGP